MTVIMVVMTWYKRRDYLSLEKHTIGMKAGAYHRDRPRQGRKDDRGNDHDDEHHPQGPLAIVAGELVLGWVGWKKSGLD